MLSSPVISVTSAGFTVAIHPDPAIVGEYVVIAGHVAGEPFDVARVARHIYPATLYRGRLSGPLHDHAVRWFDVPTLGAVAAHVLECIQHGYIRGLHP